MRFVGLILDDKSDESTRYHAPNADEKIWFDIIILSSKIPT